MTEWENRSQVSAAYLNPALVACVTAAAARDYMSAASKPMTWPMTFLIAPLVLHRPTRQALPKTTATHLASWVSRNPVLRAGFPGRAASLVPVVTEGLRFGLRHRILHIDDGAVHGLLPSIGKGDATGLLRGAQLAGRWLAKIEQPATAFAILGVEP